MKVTYVELVEFFGKVVGDGLAVTVGRGILTEEMAHNAAQALAFAFHTEAKNRGIE